MPATQPMAATRPRAPCVDASPWVLASPVPSGPSEDGATEGDGTDDGVVVAAPRAGATTVARGTGRGGRHFVQAATETPLHTSGTTALVTAARARRAPPTPSTPPTAPHGNGRAARRDGPAQEWRPMDTATSRCKRPKL